MMIVRTWPMLEIILFSNFVAVNISVFVGKFSSRVAVSLNFIIETNDNFAWTINI
jgi:ribosomal protein S19